MTTAKYFSECSGSVVELQQVGYWTIEGAQKLFAKIGASFPERYRKTGGQVALGRCPTCNQRHVTTRVIFRKANASNHKCDARCMHAKGHNCECSCGGANHGAGQ